MTLTITQSAAEQVEKQLMKRGHGIGLKLGIKKSGCTGFSYVIDYADNLTSDDLVFDQRGIKIVVSQNDWPYLEGINIDFRREGISEAFKFENPNIKAMCGCGESFAV